MKNIKQIGIQKVIKKQIRISNFQIQHQCNAFCQLFRIFESSKQFLLQQELDIPEILEIEQCKKQLNLLKEKRKLMRRSKKRRWVQGIQKITSNHIVIEKMQKDIIRLRNEGYKLGIIAQQLNISISQVSYILKNQYIFIDPRNYFVFNRIHKNWFQKVLTDENLDYGKSLSILYQKFLEYFQLNTRAISISSFRKIVKKKLQIRYRLVQKFDRRSSGNKSLQKRFKFAQQYLTLSFNNFDFIFIDESSLGHQCRPQRQWQLKNQQKIKFFERRNENICLLGAIGTNGFIGYQIVIGGNINSKIYKYHLATLIKSIRQHYQNNKNYTLILDNSQVHHSNETKQILKCINHTFLPAYTPQFNPIEKLWGSLKKSISDKSDALVMNTYKEIQRFFNELSQQEIERYCQSIIPYLEKALNKKQI